MAGDRECVRSWMAQCTRLVRSVHWTVVLTCCESYMLGVPLYSRLALTHAHAQHKDSETVKSTVPLSSSCTYSPAPYLTVRQPTTAVNHYHYFDYLSGGTNLFSRPVTSI